MYSSNDETLKAIKAYSCSTLLNSKGPEKNSSLIDKQRSVESGNKESKSDAVTLTHESHIEQRHSPIVSESNKSNIAIVSPTKPPIFNTSANTSYTKQPRITSDSDHSREFIPDETPDR